jgi:hypothetical protein
MALCGPSWFSPCTCTRYLVRATPVGVHRLAGLLVLGCGLSHARASPCAFQSAPTLNFHSPSENSYWALCHFAHATRESWQHVKRHGLSWAFVPLRHNLRSVACDIDRGSLLDPRRVRGLDTPCTTSPSGPTGALAVKDGASPGASWGSPFRAFSPSRSVLLSEAWPS